LGGKSGSGALCGSSSWQSALRVMYRCQTCDALVVRFRPYIHGMWQFRTSASACANVAAGACLLWYLKLFAMYINLREMASLQSAANADNIVQQAECLYQKPHEALLKCSSHEACPSQTISNLLMACILAQSNGATNRSITWADSPRTTKETAPTAEQMAGARRRAVQVVILLPSLRCHVAMCCRL
jgi:hypothetical protein